MLFLSWTFTFSAAIKLQNVIWKSAKDAQEGLDVISVEGRGRCCSAGCNQCSARGSEAGSTLSPWCWSLLEELLPPRFYFHAHVQSHTHTQSPARLWPRQSRAIQALAAPLCCALPALNATFSSSFAPWQIKESTLGVQFNWEVTGNTENTEPFSSAYPWAGLSSNLWTQPGQQSRHRHPTNTGELHGSSLPGNILGMEGWKGGRGGGREIKKKPSKRGKWMCSCPWAQQMSVCDVRGRGKLSEPLPRAGKWLKPQHHISSPWGSQSGTHACLCCQMLLAGAAPAAGAAGKAIWSSAFQRGPWHPSFTSAPASNCSNLLPLPSWEMAKIQLCLADPFVLLRWFSSLNDLY